MNWKFWQRPVKFWALRENYADIWIKISSTGRPTTHGMDKLVGPFFTEEAANSTIDRLNAADASSKNVKPYGQPLVSNGYDSMEDLFQRAKAVAKYVREYGMSGAVFLSLTMVVEHIERERNKTGGMS